jgi:thiol:disulfide interchange protein DsbC
MKRLLAGVFILIWASFGWAFPQDSCNQQQCSDCHTLSSEEAGYLLGSQADRVLGVEPSDVAAMWVVEVEKNGRRFPVYIDFRKNHVLRGEVVRLRDGENLTKQRQSRLNRVDVARIPLEDAVVLGEPGAPKRVIVFTDPQCSFCKKLHGAMKQVVQRDPAIVFFIKMLPLNIHPEADLIARSIVCNRSLTLLEDSFAGRPVPPPLCRAEAIDQTVALARELGIRATPTLVLPDGRPVTGFRDADALLKLLDSGSATAGRETPGPR